MGTYRKGNIPWSKGKDSRIRKQCLICEKEILVKPSLLNRKKYCSKSCLYTFTSKRLKGNSYGFKLGVTPWNKNTKGVMVAWNKGISPSKETREKIRSANLGKKYSFETKLKHRNRWLGEKNPNYVDGMSKYTDRQYNDIIWKMWREAVFVRDNWTCQKCGVRGGRLEPHHIKAWSQFPELRFDLSNGQTLCKECHKLTDNYKGKSRGKKLITNL